MRHCKMFCYTCILFILVQSIIFSNGDSFIHKHGIIVWCQRLCKNVVIYVACMYMVTIMELGTSNKSVMDFASNLTDSFEYVQLRSKGMQLEEALILFVVVGLWVCAMVLFIKQWDNIRIVQSQETRYKHSPKNLDTVKVVKKPRDSVIYKNYSRKISLTMVEREKRLLRLNSVPIMENVSSYSFRKLSPIEMDEGTQDNNVSIDVNSNM